MNIKNLSRIANSLTPYKIALVVAVALLIFIAAVSYRQIKNLQQSSEWVARSFQIDKEINNLFSYYNLMESAHYKSIILQQPTFLDTYADYKVKSEVALNRLYKLSGNIPEQRQNLDAISRLRTDLFSTLDTLNLKFDKAQTSGEEIMPHVLEAAELIRELKDVKLLIVLKKEALLKERMAVYVTQTNLTPLTSLFLALFSLIVFVIAFNKIYVHKKRIRSSESFLYNILQSTDNIINYYEPIYKEDVIKDFSVVFASQGNKEYLGLSPDEIEGKRVSEVFPYHLLNGEFQEMVTVYEDRKVRSFDRQIKNLGKNMWFRFILSPMDQGIILTAINTTPERTAEENLRVVNEELRNKNLKLEETRDFLEAILGSTNNGIMSFEPIWNQSDIVDFKYVYANDHVQTISGMNRDQLIGGTVSGLNPTIYKSGVFDKMVSAYQTGKPTEYETSYERDGNKMWFLGKAIRSGKGMTVTSINITSLKNALDELRLVNEELAIQNSILAEAKKMAKIGSFTFLFKSERFIMSDNLYRLLGHDPNEFESTQETYTKFIHPEDLRYFNKKMNQMQEQHKAVEFTYRIISKQRKIKFLKSNGSFSFRNGQKILTAVVQDITKQYGTETKLRHKNIELKRSNTELDSFNRVASHDLQEPLRKIQMFLSRIVDEDKLKLSERGQQNLEKVNQAALRMQSLIINLLTYSRIDNKHENFEKVDLNVVLEKVLEDLAIPIQDAQVSLKYDKLPVVEGVVYQMEQLFSNLVSNAIKYRNTGRVPNIKILCESVHRNQIPENFHKTDLHFHKITFVDNGIGFASEYAEKIFEVFERLHQKTEYSGTGIGLAICKKIIENHNGHIHAVSNPGMGSAFICYLPD